MIQKGGKRCAAFEILHRNKELIEKRRSPPQLDLRSAPFGGDLTKLTRALTRDGVAKHWPNLNWQQPHLSKSRYMSGRQCSKKLWLSVYDPEPAEEPLPGTVKGMGIEVGVKARLLWPGGVLVDTKYNEYAEAIKRTKALIADPSVPAIFEATLTHHGVLVRVDALERLTDGRWRLNEVKSNTRIKNEHIEDIGLQAYVVVGAGLELADAHRTLIATAASRDAGADRRVPASRRGPRVGF